MSKESERHKRKLPRVGEIAVGVDNNGSEIEGLVIKIDKVNHLIEFQAYYPYIHWFKNWYDPEEFE